AATSLYLETKKTYDVAAVLAKLLEQISPWLDHWRNGEGALCRARWEALSLFRIGEKICLRNGNRLCRGIFVGYGANGEILLRTASGQTEAIWSGEAEGIA
ncbi:MAG: hypothetical protein N3A66_08315, partial [Planctomycetota bacterium]|nr:hypothetical protein [Planctomycetota bacterium]